MTKGKGVSTSPRTAFAHACAAATRLAFFCVCTLSEACALAGAAAQKKKLKKQSENSLSAILNQDEAHSGVGKADPGIFLQIVFTRDGLPEAEVMAFFVALTFVDDRRSRIQVGILEERTARVLAVEIVFTRRSAFEHQAAASRGR